MLVEDWLAAIPHLVWRREVSYLALVEGRYRKLSRRKFYAGVAAYLRKRGYRGRGVLGELVLARVRRELERRQNK